MVVGTNQVTRLADGLIKELLSVNSRSLLKCDQQPSGTAVSKLTQFVSHSIFNLVEQMFE